MIRLEGPLCWECDHTQADHDDNGECMVGWATGDSEPTCACVTFEEFETTPEVSA